MNECFVDLTYRGLSLGRRIKLTQVRPSTGYLEHPTPMPVGTAVSITTDDGVVLDAVVTHVCEQVGGSERAPGMTVRPQLAAANAAWWSARVTLPDLEVPRPPPPRTEVTVRPRAQTIPDPPDPPEAQVAVPRTTTDPMPDGAMADAARGEPDAIAITDKPTVTMNAVDQEMLEQLARSPDVEQLVVTSPDHAVVDDGKLTIVMDAVDPSSLGIDPATSGAMAAAAADEDPGDEDSQSVVGGGGGNGDPQKRRKHRR